MGKNLENSNSLPSIQNSGPGCMWGVLHMFKYHHWRYIKKRFPHKWAVNGKNALGRRHDIKGSKSDRLLDHQIMSDRLLDHQVITEDNSPPHVDEKMTQSTSGTKCSVKTRLKSLISEELHKMKYGHRRATSCPAQSPLAPTDSIRPFDPEHHQNPPQTHENFWSPRSPDPLVSNFLEDQNAEESANDQTSRHLIADCSHSDENSGSETQNLVPPVDRYPSTSQSKEMLDALDIINMNKDFFLKVLQDPGSPFAQHFHSQQALSKRRSFSRSLSFSSTSSSPVNGSGPKKIKPKKEIIESDSVESKPRNIRSQSMTSVPATEFPTPQHRKNQAVMKRFKNLKDKIKHVIRQDKNEKHRIAMDGILHKIPHGKEIPKDLKTENYQPTTRDDNCSPRSSLESHNTISSTNYKSGSRCFSRTSSMSESLDRYRQLYETSCKGEEPKHHHFEPLKLRSEDSPQKSDSKSMKRLFSSPDLFSYNEHSSDVFPSSNVRNAAAISDHSEQSDAKSDIQQNLDSGTVSFDDQQAVNIVSNVEGDDKSDIISDHLEVNQEEQDTELSEPNDIPVPDTKCQEDNAEESDLKLRISLPLPDEIDSSSEDQIAGTIIKEIPIIAERGIEKVQIPSKHIEFQVGAKDKAEFDYVKDILELSGFSKSEQLGTWHSDDQPMDPSLFEEVSSCMFLDPEWTGNEEGLPCYHLLLFDLINEVLMEIYGRSYSYYPMPLSTVSHIRPMPVGHHVLEEVWMNISWFLSSSPEGDQLLDYVMSRDLAKYDGWLNLQFDSECVGLEVEDIIFYDLLDELICS